MSEPSGFMDILYFNIFNWNKRAEKMIHKKNTKTLPLALLGLFAILILVGTVIYFVIMPLLTLFTYNLLRIKLRTGDRIHKDFSLRKVHCN